MGRYNNYNKRYDQVKKAAEEEVETEEVVEESAVVQEEVVEEVVDESKFEPSMYIVKPMALNIRSSMDKSSKDNIVLVAHQGDEFTVTEIIGDWAHVIDKDGFVGYALKEFLNEQR